MYVIPLERGSDSLTERKKETWIIWHIFEILLFALVEKHLAMLQLLFEYIAGKQPKVHSFVIIKCVINHYPINILNNQTRKS